MYSYVHFATCAQSPVRLLCRTKKKYIYTIFQFLLPLIIEKLDSDVQSAKLDSLQTLVRHLTRSQKHRRSIKVVERSLLTTWMLFRCPHFIFFRLLAWHGMNTRTWQDSLKDFGHHCAERSVISNVQYQVSFGNLLHIYCHLFAPFFYLHDRCSKRRVKGSNQRASLLLPRSLPVFLARF